jgi:hypothetical protein
MVHMVVALVVVVVIVGMVVVTGYSINNYK